MFPGLPCGKRNDTGSASLPDGRKDAREYQSGGRYDVDAFGFKEVRPSVPAGRIDLAGHEPPMDVMDIADVVGRICGHDAHTF